MIEHIEKVKSEYTDKYVTVDAERPELARFRDLVGQVKTVNMSGRALVEFMDYNVNIGWFDIDLDFLKVVDKPAPQPKEEKKPAAAKKAPAKPAAKAADSAGEKKLSPLELARQQGAGGGAGKPAKPAAKSTADILAAARAGGKADAAAAKEEKPDRPTAKPAAKPAKPAAKPAKPAGKMSTADILAAARGDASASTDAPAEAEPAPPEPEPEPAPAPAAEEAAAPAESDGPVRVDRSSMSVDDMLAYCREHDAE